MQRLKNGFSRVAVIALGCSCLTACANGFDALGRPARADPHMAAVYHGDEARFYDNAKTYCPLTRAIDDSNYGAINLDCFRFPEDTQSDGTKMGNKNKDITPPNLGQTTVIKKATVTTTPAKLVGDPSTFTATIGAKLSPKNVTDATSTTVISSTIQHTITVPDNPTAYALATLDLDSRNRLTQILVNQSDGICTVELGRLEGRVASFNLAGDIATSGFAGAASIVGGNTAKSILAGIASFTSATKDHFNADLLHSQMTEALIQAIRIERERRS
jgi:hypothetical protein